MGVSPEDLEKTAQAPEAPPAPHLYRAKTVMDVADALNDEEIKRSVLIAPIDAVFNWARQSSMWYMLFGLACCAIELMGTGASRFDLDRHGMFFRSTPRQSDVMIVAGTVTKKMGPILKRLYDQMAAPKYVIAMGSCAISGGPFRDSYNVVMGVDTILPVDVYIPGCPPRPEALYQALLKVREKIAKESVVKKR